VILSAPARAGLLGLLTIGLTACSAAENPGTDTSLTVAAAFYPLEYVAERVGGTDVTVIGLTPPGGEPHDLELSPAGVRSVRDSDIVLYLSGFQPMVDDAVEATDADGFDVADVVPLVNTTGDTGGGHVGVDPHFWLDPTLLDLYAGAVADRFAALDPEHAETYHANYSSLSADLTEIDAAYTAGLATCERDTILVSHEAFGYLSSRYGLTQVGLSGINPEAEPSPARLKEVRDLARSIGATTVFVETLVDPSVVEAFARDADLAVATLDPIGGLVATGDDYLIIMRRNLKVLETGLGCG
jgi:zinc transport system substrate-binding protein